MLYLDFCITNFEGTCRRVMDEYNREAGSPGCVMAGDLT